MASRSLRRSVLGSSLACALIACATSVGCSSAPDAESVGAIARSVEEPLLSACTEAEIRGGMPPSAKPFFDKAFDWVHAGAMYCECVTSATSPYRADCSGLVSYAWGLPAPGHTTYSLAGGPWDDKASVKISWSQLTPGDALNFPGDPSSGVGHVMLFGGWLDSAHTKLCAVEESHTGTAAHVSQHSLSDPGSWWGGTSTFGSIFLPIRKAGYTPTPPDAPPKGSFDSADCTTIKGWAQDPDTPTAATKVRIGLDGQPGASGVETLDLVADVSRSDLCKPLGSCTHGFELPTPIGWMDGKSHTLHVVALDTATGEKSAEIASSPRTFKCDAPKPPAGILRHVTNPTSLSDWRLSSITDIAKEPSSLVASYPKGDDWPSKPELIQADDGSPAIYVVDGDKKRHVVSQASMSAWHWTSKDVTKTAAAKVAAMPDGAPLLATPFAMDDSGTIWMLDVIDPPAGSDGGSSGDDAGAPGGGAASGDGGASHAASDDGTASPAGCAMGGSNRGASGSAWLVALSALAMVGARRRRERGSES